MPPLYKRQRTSSAYEERNVSEFVESCIKFTTNVSFHTANEGKQLANETSQAPPRHPKIILLLGNQQQLRDTERVSSFFPYYCKEVEAAVNVAPVGKCYVAHITPHVRVLIGAVASRASRHNCPLRPDSITAIVHSAVAESKIQNDDGSIDIFCCESTNELCVATAVARGANRTFSAQKGSAEKNYLRTGSRVRVIFAPHDSPDRFSCGSSFSLEVAAKMVQLCARLVDAPTNLLDTTTFAEIAAGHVEALQAQGLDVSLDIIQGEELRERGYGGIYGVGKAAALPAHLVTLNYNPRGGIAPQEKIALVGKGIVYDTGGLSLKPMMGMRTMKHDMGGAAAVFCGLIGLAAVQAPVQASAVLCLAENAIGPNAQRNDDVVRMKSGRTVEINNTDAEGRLVLGDGVYHASALLPYTPDVIIDMATLTGAQGVATGSYHAALYANKEIIEERIVKAGKDCGDMCFPVLYCPEFHANQFKSDIADCKNSVADRSNAQASCAGNFIESHIDAKYQGAWAHVDMASPVCRGEPTGYGVSLILQTFAPSIYQKK